MLECLCGCLEGLWWFAIGAGIGAYRSEQLQPCMHRTGKKGAKELKRRASVKLGVISQADAEILWKAEEEEAEAKAKEEAEARARQDADVKARAEAEARAKEDTAAMVREEAGAKPREEAADGPDLQDVPMGTFVAPPDDMPLYTFAGSPDEQNMPTGTFDMPTGTFVAPDDVPEAKAEAEARAMEEAAAKAKAGAEAKAREEAAAKAKAEAEAEAREEAAAKAKAEAEAKAREDAEAKAKAEAEAKAREEAEAKAKAEAEAEEKAKEVAAAKAKELADAVAQEEAEAKGPAYRSVVRDALSKATDTEVASLRREEKLLQLAHECAALLPDKPPEDSEEASALEEQMSPLARRFGEEIFQEVVDAAEIAIAESKGESEGKGVPEALRGTEELAELARKMVACTDPAEGEALAAPEPALEEFFIGTFQVAEGPGRSSAAHEDGAGSPPTSTIADTSTKEFFIGTFPVGEGPARNVAYEETARPAMQEGMAKATIVGTSKENDTTFYRIEVYEVGASRTFLKRFNDFKTFDKALRDSSPALRKALPELPAAGLFGVRHRLGLSDFERKRQDGLQRYLDAAASQLDGSTFRAFFEGQSTSVSTPTP